ncbi:MAG: hypothetical protein R6V05_05235 [Candidatus Brocadiia bacterium]
MGLTVLLGLAVGGLVLAGIVAGVGALLGIAVPVGLAGLAVVGGALAAVAVVCAVLFFALLAINAVRAALRKGGSAVPEEDARLMQELHDGLSRLEERVEALETLLVAEERSATRS